MKHLPFNHVYRPLRCGPSQELEMAGQDFTHVNVTSITLLCACGHIKTKRIANFVLTPKEIDTYLSTVYPER